MAAAKALVQERWGQLAPDRELGFRGFLDEVFAGMYAKEERWSPAPGWMCVMATLIACMGLFGLAALAVVRRTKEVGIRKAVGASVATGGAAL